MTSSRSAASVAVVTRKEPSRVKVVLLVSKVAVTPHSFSRFCFRSRQAANAQPTAWLRRSPWKRPFRRYTEAHDVKNSHVTLHESGSLQLTVNMTNLWMCTVTVNDYESAINMSSYWVFNGHKTVADPAPRGAIPADVRECPLKVPVWSTERHLLYCLVQNQVLRNKPHNLIIVALKPVLRVKQLLVSILKCGLNFFHSKTPTEWTNYHQLQKHQTVLDSGLGRNPDPRVNERKNNVSLR